MMCAEKEITGYIALHFVSNIFFILRKSYSVDEGRKILKYILKILTVVSVNHKEVSEALDNKEFKDFEDCLQDECAKRANADYIITRNMQDFQYSKVKAVLLYPFNTIFHKTNMQGKNHQNALFTRLLMVSCQQGWKKPDPPLEFWRLLRVAF